MYGYWFYRFYYAVFAEPLSKISRKFVPVSDAGVDELLSFQVEVEVFRALNITKYPIFRERILIDLISYKYVQIFLVNLIQIL